MSFLLFNVDAAKKLYTENLIRAVAKVIEKVLIKFLK